MHKKIIISGASGRLAKLLVERLSNDNFILLGRNIDKLSRLYSDYKNVQYCSYDDFISNNSFTPEYDIFIHCAFERSENTEKLCESLNLSAKIFQKIKSIQIPYVINISSMSVYSSKNHIDNTEEIFPAPSNFYGLAKYASELLLENICKNQKVINIRLAALAGSIYEKHILSKFVLLAIQNKKIELTGGSQNFCFMDYRDALDALEFLINSDLDNCSNIYNISNNSQINIIDMAKLVINILKENHNIDSQLILYKNDDFYFDYKLNADKFMNSLNWSPKYSIKDTINEIIQNSKILQI